MKLYFSGISSAQEADFLKEAGIRLVLVDPTDFDNIAGWDGIEVLLDSGAYRVFRKSESLTPRRPLVEESASHPQNLARKSFYDWLREVQVLDNDPRIVGLFHLDVIGDERDTRVNWIRTKEYLSEIKKPVYPVWQYPNNITLLGEMLEDSEVVGIGNLVKYMREKNDSVLGWLKWMCGEFPNRFHLFGLNWLKAIEELKDLAYSADTSKWLDAARYGHMIFRHSKSGHLQQAPAKLIDKYAGLDRKARCVASAVEMANFVS